jgi:hypothetical protein
MARIAKTLLADTKVFTSLVRMIADWQTKVCQAFLKTPNVFTQHTTPKNAEYVAKAAGSENFKKHGRIFWVHSLYSPLVLPVRDRDGDYVPTSQPSLMKAWDALQKNGDVSNDFRTVSDAAFEAGLVKRTWVKRSLIYAVSADLPALEVTQTASKRVTPDAGGLMKSLRQYR